MQFAETKSSFGKKAREYLDVARSRLRLSIMPCEMQLTSGIRDQLRSLH